MFRLRGGTATARALRCGASTIVLGMAMMQPTIVFAQTADESETISQETDPNAAANPEAEIPEDAIIITGVRRALQTAQEIKRNADTVVDSISATDIGAFPDKSVAEALQRVPGITVNRFASTSDTAHFSAEPSGVIVRGLPQVRNELNGRDIFSANSSRGLSWSDVPAELLAGVDAYKNLTADMIEGGIAGSINLRTRVPFDAQGQLIQIGAKANYGDLSKEVTPDLNAFYSNRWETGAGEFGIMGHIAYSHVKTASQGVQEYRVGIFENGAFPGTTGTVYAPSEVAFRDNEYDRKRTGIAAAAQWQSTDRNLLATVQYLRSTYKTKWEERVFGGTLFSLFGQDARFRFSPGTNTVALAPGASDPVFNSGNFLESGVFNQAGGWWGDPANDAGMARNEAGLPMIHSCYSWGAGWAYPQGGFPGTEAEYCPAYDLHGNAVYTASRYNENRNMTQDLGFNLKWEATDRLRFNFDAQYVDSEIDNYDIEIGLGSFANLGVADLGTKARIAELGAPTNIFQSPGGLANPNNWFINNVMDHLEESEGEQFSLRADAEYDLDTDWMDTLKFGVRWADRDQIVRWSTYNWRNIANTWTNGCQYIYFNVDSGPGTCGDITFTGYPAGMIENAQFGRSFHGGTIGEFPFVPFEFLRSRGANLLSNERIGVGSFIPICERDGQLGDTLVEVPDSCFTPEEIADVSEETKAAYVMLKFGGPDARIGNMSIRGNIGLRYVETTNRSTGSVAFPTVDGLNPAQCPAVPLVPGGLTGTGTAPDPLPPGEPPFPSFCYLTPEDLAFSSGGGTPWVAKAKHRHWLPALNVRLDITPQWLLRFAASRAMSRPDIGLLKAFQRIAIDLPTNTADPRWIRDNQGNLIGVNPTYTATGFNPFVKPTTAWQFDLSLEHYFSNVGQFSVALFHKKFSNYIQFGNFNVDQTINGITREVETRTAANGSGAKVQGMEVAFNTFFDFLPDPFNGFGIQTNYTYVRNKGVPNSNLSLGNGTDSVGNTGDRTAGTALNPGWLEGLSKHTFNVVGLYEKGPFAARLAYNWRSRYLITAVDCCVGLPVWQKSAGFLDASIRYKITDNVELSLEGSNILNTKTVLQQQITDEESPEGERILMPNAWFQNDRRFIAGVRVRFGS